MRYIFRSKRRLTVAALDCAIFALCYYLSFFLRLEKFGLGLYRFTFLSTLPLALVLDFGGMYAAGVYRGIWRYASLRDLLNIIKGAAYGTAALVMGVVFLHGTVGYPRSVFLINYLLVIMGVGGARFTRRFHLEMIQAPQDKKGFKPVIIVGAGDAADDLIRELRHNPRIIMRPIGIVDDEPDKIAQEIHGVKVIGRVEDLPRLAAEKEAEEILITIPSATGPQMRRIVDICRRTGIPYRTVPGTGDILDGRVHVHHLRNVKMEDLLRRPPVNLDRKAIRGYIEGKRVLVTGAGGSIGSELCRQVARYGPIEVILMDHSENSLFYLDEEFCRLLPGLNYRVVVADITHARRMEQIMRSLGPEVIFHAAAHKHVPLMEKNFHAAFHNNVTGTRVLAEAAVAAGVGKFIMISTDKAVNPTSIMGVSKRLAEMVIQEIERRNGKRTEFVSVRFGNVMGSEGSVLPLFARQIEAGGPVTVTHPEVMRYFMTIPEAVQLVLQAAAMGRGGEIFILHMGEPIRILDLARDMITLSGLEPDEDIQIKFTGLRPGEKLYEDLITQGEGIMPTQHEEILVLKPDQATVKPDVLERIISLEEMVKECAGQREIMARVRDLVPEYRTNAGPGVSR